MTGSPLLRLFAVVAGLALLAIPAWRLTGRETSAVVQPPVAETTPDSAATVELTFTSPIPPAGITVEADGSKIANCNPRTSSTTVRVPLQLPTEGVDLVVKTTWPDSSTGPNALRVQVTVEGKSLADTTLWGSPDVEDVVTLPGASKP
ncbi:MAG: hypothetical protein ACOYMS_11615 [Terrimicrobiaceae bacterium]